MKDILPMFVSPVLTIGGLLVYIYTGNMVLSGWIVYVGTPLYNMLFWDDERNLDKKDEKKFMTSKWFVVPLYAQVFAWLLMNLYCLAIFSTNFKVDHWIFKK